MTPASDPTDEGSKVVELRHEVAELRRQLAAAHPGGSERKPWTHRLRTVVMVLLVVIGSVLAPIATVTVFLRGVVLNTDQYLAIVGPLPASPAVASAMSDQATDRLFAAVDVTSRIEGALPKRADFLAEPLSTTLKSATRGAADRVIASDQFHAVWIQMNRKLHHTLVGLLTGSQEGAVRADHSGTVTLDLSTLIQNVIHRLDHEGITVFNRLPADRIHTQITIMQAPGLVKAQGATKKLNALAWVLPFAALAFFVAAVVVAYRRRRALMWCGLGLSIAMGVLSIIMGLARTYLLNAASHHSLSPPAAAVLFDAVLEDPRQWARILLAVGLVVVVVAWLCGPSRPVVALRRGLAGGFRWIWSGISHRDWHLGRLQPWLVTNRAVIQGVIGAVGLIILLWWGTPGLGVSIVVVVVTLALIGLVQWICHRPPPGAPDAADAQRG